MRVALLTTGRFWLVDLARELARVGHEPLVYSLVPPWLTRRHGLPEQCNRWLGPYVAPLYLGQRFSSGLPGGRLLDHALLSAVDRVAAARLEPCDVLVAMSGIAVRALDVARRRYGAKVFLERASHHILSQRAILDAIPGAEGSVADHSVDRELAGYGLTDVITVPAQQVADSFLERGFPAERLFVNPFGTAIDTFTPTVAPPLEPPVIVMTGTWSLRKGCDVLVAAWRQLSGVRLLHVGPVGDAPLPEHPLFEHVDAVPQAKLAEFYARAHVFALASREEGLALVQVQALACGLPLVCTTRTGGGDLRAYVKDDTAVMVVPPDDPTALANALREALARRQAPGSRRDFLEERRAELSWAAYAARYEARMVAELRTKV